MAPAYLFWRGLGRHLSTEGCWPHECSASDESSVHGLGSGPAPAIPSSNQPISIALYLLAYFAMYRFEFTSPVIVRCP